MPSSSSSVHIIDFSSVSTSPLNPLGHRLRCYILQQLDEALANPAVRSIVVTGGLRNFSAGADLSEFASFQKGSDNSPSLIDVVNALEASSKPVVAALAGNALGGGLEVALACHCRIATPTAVMGLPEVKVGVIPGAGGTQRLPRLVGLPVACRMILTGTPVKASSKVGRSLVDAVVESPEAMLEKAQAWATWLELNPASFGRITSQLPLVESPAEAHVILHTAALALPTRGVDGQKAVLKALRGAYTAPTFDEGMKIELECFIHTLVSSQGQALRHAFFAVRAVQKPISVVDKQWRQHALLSAPTQTAVAVVGAGTMGRGIALVLLKAGYKEVYLVDVQAAALHQGLEFLQRTISSHAKRGKVKNAPQLLSRLRGTQELPDLKDCMLVVEAVVEKMSIKQKIFQELDRILPAGALLLSNTSTLDIDAMASVVRRRELFAGWHFFSPAHVMKLVEIVVGRETAAATVALLQVLTKRIGKIGVVVGNCDGFCGNRLLKPYSAESVLLLTEARNSVADVDKAFLEFGMSLGPLQMSDLAGNDVGYYVRKARGWVRDDETATMPQCRPERYTELADAMVSQLGRLGQKAGKGWYDYDPAIGKGRKGLPSEEMERLIFSYRTASISSYSTTPQEMIERVFYPLVNEGFKCLEEGIVRSPSDIDVVYLYGYGWPAWRGGPMYWADHEVTLPVLLQKLRDLHRRYPSTEHYRPAVLLEECVQLGVTVEDYFKENLVQKKGGQLSRL